MTRHLLFICIITTAPGVTWGIESRIGIFSIHGDIRRARISIYPDTTHNLLGQYSCQMMCTKCCMERYLPRSIPTFKAQVKSKTKPATFRRTWSTRNKMIELYHCNVNEPRYPAVDRIFFMELLHLNRVCTIPLQTPNTKTQHLLRRTVRQTLSQAGEGHSWSFVQA
jgi:hypothetical protein